MASQNPADTAGCLRRLSSGVCGCPGSPAACGQYGNKIYGGGAPIEDSEATHTIYYDPNYGMVFLAKDITTRRIIKAYNLNDVIPAFVVKTEYGTFQGASGNLSFSFPLSEIQNELGISSSKFSWSRLGVFVNNTNWNASTAKFYATAIQQASGTFAIIVSYDEATVGGAYQINITFVYS